jgi:integrase
MTGRAFTSAFAAELDAYLTFKQNMGHYGNSRIWYLRKFDTWCAGHGRTVFDKDTVEGWVSAQLQCSGRHRSWMSYIRDFGRWLQASGASDAYVLSDRWKAPFVPPRPYLLSARQIELFFTAAAALQSQSPWRWQACAFFTLMHSCGLRTGEARALQPGHVDLDDGHIDVVWSKGNRSRRLPVTTQVARVLAACDRTSRAHFASRATFFVSAAGNQVSPCTVGTVFARIWDQAGLARPAGGQQPRPYSFRHHFAYACIERWMRQGKDVAAMLPYLSRYMGHATFDSTYYYIHTSPDFLDAYADITANSQSLLPEVGFG